MQSGIVEFCIIFLRVSKALWYCGIHVIFSTCGMHSGIVGFRVMFFHVWKALWYCGNLCDNISACGMRSGIFCYIFLCVERTLLFCIVLFFMWNALWCFVLHFSACKTHPGILCYIFPHMERALVFCVVFFCV